MGHAMTLGDALWLPYHPPVFMAIQAWKAHKPFNKFEKQFRILGKNKINNLNMLFFQCLSFPCQIVNDKQFPYGLGRGKVGLRRANVESYNHFALYQH